MTTISSGKVNKATANRPANTGLRVYVKSNRFGVRQAELDVSSINPYFSRINLEDLESVSRNLRVIVQSLELEQGRYSVYCDGNKSKSAFDKLKELSPEAWEVPGKSQPRITFPSREDLVRAEIEDAYSPTEAAESMRISRQALQKKRRENRVLGLKIANCYVYPKWQFDVSGQLIEGLAPVLRHLFSSEKSPLEVIARLNDRRPFLEGRSIKDCLVEGLVEDAEMASEGLASTRQ